MGWLGIGEVEGSFGFLFCIPLVHSLGALRPFLINILLFTDQKKKKKEGTEVDDFTLFMYIPSDLFHIFQTISCLPLVLPEIASFLFLHQSSGVLVT